MKEYKEFQNQLAATEKEESKSDLVEQHVPTAFLFLGAAISGAATYYLNELGMKASPLYARTIGAENAAVLVMGIIEGTFLALTVWGSSILKSKPQRLWGKRGLLILKIVLAVNIIVAAVMLSGFGSSLKRAVDFYAQWGAPATVAGAIWLWAFIVSNRRKTIMRNQMLDDAAQRTELWATQYQVDQQRYRAAYQMVSGSPEMDALRDEIARTQAIEQIAKESNISIEAAATIYQRVTARQTNALPGSTQRRIAPLSPARPTSWPAPGPTTQQSANAPNGGQSSNP